jgi:hypothetical protein
MLSSDPNAVPSHDVLGLDIFQNDPVDWDAWLTPEAFHDGFSPSSNENSNVTQPIDGKQNSMTTHLRTSIPGEHGFARRETTENLPFVIKEKEHLKSSKPKAAPGFENRNQRRVLSSPEYKFLEVQDIEREALQNYKPGNNWAQVDEYVERIQATCQIATGETLSKKQAQKVKNCGDSLIANIQPECPIPALKAFSVNCHLHTLPSIDTNGPNSSLRACVTYLSYLNSIAGSRSRSNDVNRRLAQIWIYVHFENHVNDLMESEKNGLPLNRKGRTISTIARDSILQAFHGAQYVPQKAGRDFLSNQCRWGERWWKVAACMGLGVILLASDDLANQMYAHSCSKLRYYLLTLNRGKSTAFQNKMVDMLVIYVLNRYPDMMTLCRSLEPIVAGLMLGGDSVSSRNQLDISLETLGEGKALMSCNQERWLIPNLVSLSRLAASQLISIQRV